MEREIFKEPSAWEVENNQYEYAKERKEKGEFNSDWTEQINELALHMPQDCVLGTLKFYSDREPVMFRITTIRKHIYLVVVKVFEYESNGYNQGVNGKLTGKWNTASHLIGEVFQWNKYLGGFSDSDKANRKDRGVDISLISCYAYRDPCF